MSPTRSRASADHGDATSRRELDGAGARRSSFTIAAITAVVVVALDQASKQWALDRLSLAGCSVPDGCIELVGTLRLRLVENPGSAFSIGTSLGPALAVVAAVMAVVLLGASARVDRWLALAFGLVAGGAVGNLIDRVVRADDGILTGAVVDFVDLQWWPVFNVADAAIVGGVVALALLTLRSPAEGRASEAG